jgi:hypothetical protein
VRKIHTSDKRGSQGELVSAMLEPCFYPKRPSKVAHKETHISHLFLTDNLVYKVKKAVRFSFLDYSTLAKRRHFLNEELRQSEIGTISLFSGHAHQFRCNRLAASGMERAGGIYARHATIA